jgi:hypothetical protein
MNKKSLPATKGLPLETLINIKNSFMLPEAILFIKINRPLL